MKKLINRFLTNFDMDPRSGEPHFGMLLFLLFCILVVTPMVIDSTLGSIVLEILIAGVLIHCCYMMTGLQYVRLVGVLLAIPAFLFGVGSRYFDTLELVAPAALFGALFFALIAFVFGRRLFTSAAKISANTVHGSICIYVLIGLTYAYIYILVDTLLPGSFTGSFTLTSDLTDPEDTISHLESFYYFSFVTLSTLGYGDLTPVSGAARSIAIVETLTGQFYIATFVARLIAIFTAQAHFNKPSS